MKINPVQIANIFLVLNCLIYASDTMKVDSSQLFSTDMIDPTRAELLDITENNVIEELYPKFQFV